MVTQSALLLQVCYYRYIRFYPSGRFLYKVVIAESLNSNVEDINNSFLFSDCYYLSLSPARQNSSLKVKDVAKIMNIRAAKADSVFSGHYSLSDDKVSLFFPLSYLTNIYKFRIRSSYIKFTFISY